MDGQRGPGGRSGPVVAIVFLSMTLCVIAGLIIAQATGGAGPGGSRGGSPGAQAQISEPAGGVLELRVEMADIAIELVRSGDGEIHASYPADADIYIREGNGRLTYYQEYQFFSFRGWGGERQVIRVEVPDGIESIALSTASGSIQARGVACGDFSASSASGRIELSDIDAAGALAAESASGSLSAQDIRAQSIGVRSTSGRVEAGGLSADDVAIRSVSGRVEAQVESRCALSAETTSGRIDLSLGGTARGSVSSTSGSVTLRVASGQTVRCSSVSGGIRLNGSRVEGDSVLQGGEDSLSVKTISGGIEIEQ